ncbi:MAG: HEAT repeat domain-containing protein [Proteobacteria bacterium]|nr:HEAT repeat domain-containing protein [Pseudomonadota bacterium]
MRNLFLTFSLLIAQPIPVLACSCDWILNDGFVTDLGSYVFDKNGVAQVQEKFLPPNAKGVLFYVSPFNTEWAKVKWDHAFSAVDTTDSKAMSVKVRHLKLELPGDSSSPKEKPQLFRVEPVGGFKPKHRYTFHVNDKGLSQQGRMMASGNSVVISVLIGAEPLAFPPRNKVTIKPDGLVSTAMVSVPQGGMCSGNILSRQQKISTLLPTELEPYKESLLYFTALKSEKTGKTQSWNYVPDMCSGYKFGRSHVGYAKDLIYASCSKELRRDTQIALDEKYLVLGTWAFWEMHDDPISTNVLKVTFDSQNGACDQAKHTKSMFTNSKANAAELCRMGTSQIELTASEMEEIIALVGSKEAEVRKCSLVALIPIPYRLQNGTSPEIWDRIEYQMLPAAAKAVSDSDLETRKSAAELLLNLSHIWVEQDSRRPQLDFKPVLSKMAVGLKDQDQGIRIRIAEAISRLRERAKSVVPALIAAVTDFSKPNYAAPTALAAVDPQNPLTIKALLKALKHPDSLVRDTSAQALGKSKDPSVLNSLMDSAKENNNGAIQAMGELGIISKPAVPLLFNLLRTSKLNYVRSSCIESLVQIGESRKEVVDALVNIMRLPNDEFEREKAIVHLGQMGPESLSAVPAMIEVLDKKPKTSEMGAMVRTWDQIKPPKSKIVKALRRIISLDKEWAAEEATRLLEQLDGK